MKLKVAELKQFNQKSSQIPTNTLIPILSYLKFEPGQVTKNSLNSFICMAITCEGSMLVDEKQLMAFVNYTKSDTIDLTVKDGSILITDGTKIKYTSPTEDIKNFPVNDTPSDESWILIENSLLNDISIASIFSVDDDMNAVRSHVFVGNGLIAGCDNIIAYLRKNTFDKSIVLGKSVATILGGLTDVKFNENDRYQFFISGNCKYGFIKPIARMVDFSPFLNCPEGLQSFTISKSLLIAINELAIARSPQPAVIGSLEANEGILTINFTDSNYELSLKHELPCIGGIEGDFNYNAAIVNRMLKTLPDDLLKFTLYQNKLYVTCDNNSFISLIMRIKI